jgi:hypothetical protein
MGGRQEWGHDRTDPLNGAERNTLVSSLDAARRHILGAVEGLSDSQLRTTTLPSGWTPLGLIHLDAARELLDGQQWLVLG